MPLDRSLILTLFAYVIALTCKSAGAQTVFSDDFESYSNQSEFATSWSAIGAPPHVLDTSFGYNSNHSVELVPQATGTGTSNRWYRDIASPVVPSNVNPVVFGFDFYLDPAGANSGWSADWQLADLRAFSGGAFGLGSLQSVVGMGVSRPGSQNFDLYNANSFQGRFFTIGGPSSTYYSLDALNAVPRSSGWHSLAVRIGATQSLFSVDGQPAELVNLGVTTPITSIVLGSDISSVHPFWIDNIRLKTVPEPGVMYTATVAVVGFALLRIRRKHQQVASLS